LHVHIEQIDERQAREQRIEAKGINDGTATQ